MMSSYRMARVAEWLLVAIVVGLAWGGSRSLGQDVASVITQEIFDSFLPYRNADGKCESRGFYSREAFLEAARWKEAEGFGSKKHELAAFFANVAHETGQGCYIRELGNHGTYKYYGRGPLQLTHQYNYLGAGKAIHEDLVSDPDRVATDAVISFKTAVWFWMMQPESGSTPHDCMNRSPANFGCTISAINGGQECGANGNAAERDDRIKNYKSFCNDLGISVGQDILSCR